MISKGPSFLPIVYESTPGLPPSKLYLVLSLPMCPTPLPRQQIVSLSQSSYVSAHPESYPAPHEAYSALQVGYSSRFASYPAFCCCKCNPALPVFC
jgi:hypothetical protein